MQPVSCTSVPTSSSEINESLFPLTVFAFGTHLRQLGRGAGYVNLKLHTSSITTYF